MNADNPITKAIKLTGGASKLATKLGVTYQAVRKWELAGIPPPCRAIQIEAATLGQVTRQHLRPDLYPKEAA